MANEFFTMLLQMNQLTYDLKQRRESAESGPVALSGGF
jgi:hypothetical protein